jgi:Tfp pilus assembly protein PilF
MRIIGFVIWICLICAWNGASAQTRAADEALSSSTAVTDDAFQRGLRRYAAKEYAQAAVDFEEALKTDSNSVEKLYFAGYAYYKSQNMDKAVTFFNRAYSIDPNFSPVPLPTPGS